MGKKICTIPKNPPYATREQKVENLKKEIAELKKTFSLMKEKEKNFVAQQAKAESALKIATGQLAVTNAELEEFIQKYNQMVVGAEVTSAELNQFFNTSGDGRWVIDQNFNIQRINTTLATLLNKKHHEAKNSGRNHIILKTF